MRELSSAPPSLSLLRANWRRGGDPQMAWNGKALGLQLHFWSGRRTCHYWLFVRAKGSPKAVLHQANTCVQTVRADPNLTTSATPTVARMFALREKLRATGAPFGRLRELRASSCLLHFIIIVHPCMVRLVSGRSAFLEGGGGELVQASFQLKKKRGVRSLLWGREKEPSLAKL